MADNVAITAGSGTTVATDDVGSVQYQRVKLTMGADGVALKDMQPALSAVLASGTSDAVVTGADVACTVFGWSIKEDAGSPAAATVVVRDGTNNSGTAIAYVNLASSESVRDWFGPQGIKFATGVWIDRLTGTTSVTIYYVVT